MQANSCDAQGGGADAAQPEMCQHPSPVSPNLGGANLGFSLWTTRQGILAKYSAVDLISSEVAPSVPYAVEWAEPVVESVMSFLDLSSISDSRCQRGVPPRSGTPYKQVLTSWSQRLPQQCGRQNLLVFPSTTKPSQPINVHWPTQALSITANSGASASFRAGGTGR